MNFFEAWQEMEKGKIRSTGVGIFFLKYKVEKGELYFHNYNEWSLNKNKISALMAERWKIYEEPKERKGLRGSFDENDKWMHNIQIKVNTGNNILSIYPHYYKIESQRNAWATALNTFMRLKGHFLAVKPEDRCCQYYLVINIPDDGALENCRITYLSADQFEWKARCLSPFFTSGCDAAQAIKDIGTDNLLHMFKTFQGIYE